MNARMPAVMANAFAQLAPPQGVTRKIVERKSTFDAVMEQLEIDHLGRIEAKMAGENIVELFRLRGAL